MISNQYAKFCLLIGYKVLETPHSVWIGPKCGFFNRMPLYETTPPEKEELELLFKKHRILGVNYAAEPDCKGKLGHNYFVRDQNYNLNSLDKKSRSCVQKGLDNCTIRPMRFDELHRLGMPLNLDTLNRQERTDLMFSNAKRWECFCQAGENLDTIEAWGSFVHNELSAYLVLIRLDNVVSVLYSHSRTSLLASNSSSALFFTVTQTMMQTPGVEAVYNGPEWLASSKGLDHFKRRLGFVAEPVAFVSQLQPLASRLLLNRGVRRTISSLCPLLLSNDVHQQIETVLDMAAASTKG